jgi:putative membrane protein
MPHLLHVLRGYLMGSADVVPGVSGGTVALVLGIYERLVGSIHAGAATLGWAVRGRFGDARRRIADVEWGFLLPLLAGILLAVVSLASVLERLLHDEPQVMAALFFGLVAGSIVIAWRLVGSWTSSLAAAGAVAAIAAFALLGLRSDAIADPRLVLYFGAGMVAIVAMILPGVSGSFILLMLGMYQAVLAAVNERSYVFLLVLIAGAVIGLAAFSTLLHRLLRDHHDLVVACLIGLMAGSLRVLWPWPDGTETARLAAPTDWGVPLVVAVTGFALVVAVGAISRRSTGPPTPTDEATVRRPEAQER